MRHRSSTAARPRRRTAVLAAVTAAAVAAGLAVLTGTASAATTTRVTSTDIAPGPCDSSPALWCHDGNAAVVNEAGANEGNGFLRLSTTAGDKADVYSRALYGKPLSTLSTLSYETYIETPGTNDARQAPSFNIEMNGPKGFTSIVWEPVYSGAAVTVGNWQTWNPGTQKGWWASKDVTSTGTPNKYGFNTYTATFADVVTAMTGYTIIDIGINQGSGAPGLVARADRFTVNDTVYDFDNPVAATTIAKTAGDGQTAVTGANFATPLAVKLTGAGNLPAAGAPVTFAVTKGSASFTGPATVNTGTDGVATAPPLKAGTDAGPVTVTATSGALSTTFTETVTAPAATGAKRADLAVTLSVPATVAPGKSITATVTVRNNGPYAATNIATALTMPNGLIVTAAPGGIAPRNGHNVAWLTPQLGASTQVTYTVTLTADPKAKGPQSVRAATITGSVSDPNLFNNVAVTSVIVR